jgi:hypothetical protein
MPDLNAFGTVGTFFFGLLSIYLYFRGKQRAHLVGQYRVHSLQQRRHSDVRILFRGEEVTSLSRAVVTCWNAGSIPIRAQDVPTTAPLVIRLPEGSRVLSTSILGATSDAIAFSVLRAAATEVNFSFAYLQPRDGATFEILFDSKEGPGASNLLLTGIVIGAPLPILTDASELGSRQGLSRPAIILGAGIIALSIPAGLSDFLRIASHPALFITSAFAGLLLIGVGVGAALKERAFHPPRINSEQQ